MKRILLSSALLVSVLGALAVGSTGAFFSDTETSAGNTFAAGAIDLLIDNTSYYNGSSSPTTSWTLRNLTVEKFFNFLDVKPGDYGEDTISLHVNTNDAYLCADVALTSNEENTILEPEAEDGDTTSGPGQGELAQNINFIWWADDGDNVLEDNETPLPGGPLSTIGIGSTTTVSFADSQTNLWTGVGGAAPGNQTLYIGKAWCFGAITPARLPQDNATSSSPAGNRDATNPPGQPSDGGYLCSGSGLDNQTQTDSMTANISFTAVQARNNPGFLCTPGQNCEIDTTVTLLPTGGFESPEVTNGAQWDIFPSPAGSWNVAWRSDISPTFGAQTRPTIANLELHEGVLGSASEGDQYAELDTDWGGPGVPGDGEPASVTIYQDIPTIVGKEYQIRYMFAARPDTAAAENNVEVRWGGAVVDTTGPTAGVSGSIVWNERVVHITATTTTTRIQITDLGTANSIGSFVDNIRLYQEVCTPVVTRGV